MAEFLNVYNFVPFPAKKGKCYEDTDKHTGVITYKITTKTPLFIPNTSNDDAFQMKTDEEDEKKKEKHPSYDFYSYREMNESKDYTDDPEVPVIPGSELRGMVRSIYETLTDSCMGVLNEDSVPVIRPGERSTFKASLMVKKDDGSYELEQAFCYTYEDENEPNRKIYLTDEYKEGQMVFIEKGRKSDGRPYAKDCRVKKSGTCRIPGYIMKGMPDGSFHKKKGVRVFVKNMYADRTIGITEADVERLKKVIRSYQEQPTAEENSYKEYEERLEQFLNGKGENKIPVYYAFLRDNNKNTLIYLSPACITKEISHHSIGKLAGTMVPCRKMEERCPACDLFGRIGNSNEDALVSKIRFTDAYAEKEDAKTCYAPIVTLPALAEPKLGAVEFYLQKPAGAQFWTYDYYVDGSNLEIKKGALRGRKYYWHQPDVKLPENVEKTILNKTVRPVRENVKFIAKVYFDGISGKQLEQLKWILNCGEKESNLAYKLGGGKPLGLGSIECEIISVTEREIALIDEAISYKEVPKDLEICDYDSDKLGFSQSCKEEFLFMSNYYAIKEISKNNPGVIISYPITQDQYNAMAAQNQTGDVTEGFKWFVENHDGRVKPRGHVVKAALPGPTGNPCMPCHNVIPKKNKS